MRKLPYILSVISLLLSVDLAHAGDQEDAAATMDAIRAAWNAGDVAAAEKHHLARFPRHKIIPFFSTENVSGPSKMLRMG